MAIQVKINPISAKFTPLLSGKKTYTVFRHGTIEMNALGKGPNPPAGDGLLAVFEMPSKTEKKGSSASKPERLLSKIAGTLSYDASTTPPTPKFELTLFPTEEIKDTLFFFTIKPADTKLMTNMGELRIMLPRDLSHEGGKFEVAVAYIPDGDPVVAPAKGDILDIPLEHPRAPKDATSSTKALACSGVGALFPNEVASGMSKTLCLSEGLIVGHEANLSAKTKRVASPISLHGQPIALPSGGGGFVDAYQDLESGFMDLLSNVLCHEIGHSLGLEHTLRLEPGTANVVYKLAALGDVMSQIKLSSKSSPPVQFGPVFSDIVKRRYLP